MQSPEEKSKMFIFLCQSKDNKQQNNTWNIDLSVGQ